MSIDLLDLSPSAPAPLYQLCFSLAYEEDRAFYDTPWRFKNRVVLRRMLGRVSDLLLDVYGCLDSRLL